MKWTISMALLLGFIASGAAMANGDEEKISVTTGGHIKPYPFRGDVKLLSYKDEGGPAQFLRVFAPTEYCQGCGVVTLTIWGEGGLVYHGPKTQEFVFTDTAVKSIVLDIDIPPDTTSVLHLRYVTEGEDLDAKYYFVTTDSVLRWGARLDNLWPKPPTALERVRATMTPEQLNEEFEVKLYLLRCIQREIDYAEKTLGTSLTPTDSACIYRARATREQLMILEEYGIAHRRLNREGQSNSPRPGDGVEPEDGSTKGHSTGPRSCPGVYLIGVDNETPEGKLPVDTQCTIYIGICNGTGGYIQGMTNGFRVYSPDGADWTATAADTTGPLSWANTFDLVNSIRHFSCDGNDEDTVGFGHSVLSGDGLPNGFDDTAWSISIGPFASGDVGKAICVDSTWFRPSSTWLWAPGPVTPAWDGPHCWDITMQDIQASGTVGYVGAPVGGVRDTLPISYAALRLYDRDGPGDSLIDFLYFGSTDANGSFSFPPVLNVDSGGTGQQDLFVRVYAGNTECEVTVDLPGNPSYWDTPENMMSPAAPGIATSFARVIAIRGDSTAPMLAATPT